MTFPHVVDVLAGVRFLEKSRFGVEILFETLPEVILDTWQRLTPSSLPSGGGWAPPGYDSW